MYALIENNVVKKYPYSVTDLKKANPNTSFPAKPTEEVCYAYGLRLVYFTTPPEITSSQVMTEGLPVFNAESNRWEQVWEVRDKTPEELEAETQAKAAEVRQQRDDLLAQSDWTQVLDAPVDQVAWADYRQALRDVPQQEGFPWNVIWPDTP
jgi:hypothetical protein